MKKQIPGFIVYRTESYYEEEERFQFRRYDPRSDPKETAIFVMEHTLEVEVPDDFDPRPKQVAQLVAKKEEAGKQFAALCTEIDRRINELLALEMTVEG